jgi:hypothetical protein
MPLERRNRRIFDAWMSCDTQDDIAERENLTKQAVSQFLADLPKLDKSDLASAEHIAEAPDLAELAAQSLPGGRLDLTERGRDALRAMLPGL